MNNCLQSQIECILFPLSQPHFYVRPFRSEVLLFLLFLSPHHGSNAWETGTRARNSEQQASDITLVAASTTEGWGFTPHCPLSTKSSQRHCAQRCLLPKRTIASQRNTFPAVHCVQHCWERATVPSMADAINTNPSWRRPRCFLLSSASWSSAKVPDEPRHIQFQSF